MAATAQKKYRKRRRGQRSQKPKKQANGRLLIIGVAILVVGLLAFGTVEVLGIGDRDHAANSSVVSVDAGALESVNIDDKANQQTVVEAPVTEADRETRFLGPPTDPTTVSLAEAGKLEQPALLWFHADW